MNPSTADETSNDPTIERQIRRAKALGYGGIGVLNVGGIRETDSRKAWQDEDPIGPLNLETIRDEIRNNPGGMFIAGWGRPARNYGADDGVLAVFRDTKTPLFCLGINNDGSPKHPLYVGYDVQPVRYL